MTEHSRITVPPTGGRPTLLERAQESFGLDRFAPAPMPRELAPARRPQLRTRTVPAQVLAETPADATQPATSLPRVDFRGERQAIDRDRLRAAGLIVPGGPVTALFEEFRIVRRQVLLAAREAQRRMGPKGAQGAAQRVLICSPLPGEGKTFTATNLAMAIATEKDTEVVLVDADFAKPSILSLLGLTGGLGGAHGLMDALADPEIRVEDCVIPTDIDRLFVLPAGHRTATDSEYLASSRTGQVLDRLTQGASERIVIFDSPPALAASPAAELAKHVAQALLIARAGRTGQSALEDAVSLLSGCPDIKLLLNDAYFSPSGRRFGDYYGYGEQAE